jgi:V8-like Glu-specific endopeptidase
MKKSLCLLLIAAVAVSCSKKSDSTTTTEYSNKITLGTGLNPSNLFELTGVGTTFTAGTLVYFRLECAADMGGSDVRIQIDNQDGTPYSTIPDYHNTQSYGHIFLSGFSIPDAGSYKATAILVTGLKTVASINFVLK